MSPRAPDGGVALMQSLLQPFGPNIWIVDAGAVSVAGFRYPTRMAVMRLSDGGLFVWSPVALSDALRADVAGLGPARFIVAPNALHHLYLAAWRAAWPKAAVFAAPGLRKRRPDLDFDGDLGDAPDPAWAAEIDQVVMRGNLITEEVVFFHRESGTVLFTDLLQNFPPGWFKGWRGVVARLDGLTGDEPRVPQKFRVAFTNRKAARAALARIKAWPAQAVLMAHGTPIQTDARAFLDRAFRWL